MPRGAQPNLPRAGALALGALAVADTALAEVDYTSTGTGHLPPRARPTSRCSPAHGEVPRRGAATVCANASGFATKRFGAPTARYWRAVLAEGASVFGVVSGQVRR